MRDVPVIDLFAGPGGLSFGFSAFRDLRTRFRIRLSIEKDPTAYQTLLLRAFLRQLSNLPDEYLEFIRAPSDEGLSRLRKRFPGEWHLAERETKCWELGKQPFADVSQSIREALAGTRNWVLLGGPPCQAYSLAGRSRMKHQVSFAGDHRHTLYREYLRVVALHEPAVFVMENVKGILSSQHGTRSGNRSIFQQILTDLRNPGEAMRETSDNPRRTSSSVYSIYSFTAAALTPELLKPEDFVIHSEEWGVPQRRHRVILLGVRNDLLQKPKTLSEFFSKEMCSIESVIGRMPRIRSRLSAGPDEEFDWRSALRAAISAAMKEPNHRDVGRLMTTTLKELQAPRSTGNSFVRGKGKFKPDRLCEWLWDERLGGVIQHEARGHMPKDIARYYFSACFASETQRSPTLSYFPSGLLPKHKNVGRQRGKKDFADRFRVQVKGSPSTTITAHIAKDGNYYIHYDPKQCRSLTVREAARLQTFPDTYFFFGGRTAQYHQVGNAVPPLLASKLAMVVANLLEGNEAAPQVCTEPASAFA